jgi:hypothetical protein
MDGVRLKLKRDAVAPRLTAHEPSVARVLSGFAQRSFEANRRIRRRQAIAFGGALLLFLLMVAMAFMRPDFNRRESPDWKPVLALAEAALAKGELLEARGLYLRTGRLAGWREDWAGLLAAACGVKKLERERGPYSTTNMLLLRAMIAAETRQSRSGMAALARAFASVEQHETASMVLARIRPNWPEETTQSPGC